MLCAHTERFESTTAWSKFRPLYLETIFTVSLFLFPSLSLSFGGRWQTSRGREVVLCGLKGLNQARKHPFFVKLSESSSVNGEEKKHSKELPTMTVRVKEDELAWLISSGKRFLLQPRKWWFLSLFPIVWLSYVCVDITWLKYVEGHTRHLLRVSSRRKSITRYKKMGKTWFPNATSRSLFNHRKLVIWPIPSWSPLDPRGLD